MLLETMYVHQVMDGIPYLTTSLLPTTENCASLTRFSAYLTSCGLVRYGTIDEDWDRCLMRCKVGRQMVSDP